MNPGDFPTVKTETATAPSLQSLNYGTTPRCNHLRKDVLTMPKEKSKQPDAKIWAAEKLDASPGQHVGPRTSQFPDTDEVVL